MFGYRVWPGILAGAFLTNVTTAGPIPASVMNVAGNTLEALVGAFLVNRFANGRRAFEHASDVFMFSILGGLFVPMVGAIGAR